MQNTAEDESKARVLRQAFDKAAQELGLPEPVVKIFGNYFGESEGDKAILLVRIYRRLFALTGGELKTMSHWMNNYNHGTGGVPSEQARTTSGLQNILEHLEYGSEIHT